jgi:hypothetical protein
MSNKTSKTKKPAPAKPQGSGPIYISFNRDEWAALQKLGFRERWAYAQLKWLSNFKTGILGKHFRQRISYQDIANLVTAPGVQGRGMGNIDDTQAADFMQRMATVGLLVQHPTRANGGLVFELPLSPIDRKPQIVPAPQPVAITLSTPVMAISPDQHRPEAAISPDEDIPPFDENPAATRVCDAPTLSLSVMALKESNINTDGAPSAHAEAAPPSRATGAAAVREISHRPRQAGAPLTAADIQSAVAGSWSFTGSDTPEARQLYQSWADAGITHDDLHAAMSGVEGALEGDNAVATPADLSPRLWPRVVDGWERQLAA